MKKIVLLLIGVFVFSSILYSIPSHPSDIGPGYNWRIDSPWTANNYNLGTWHANAGVSDPITDELQWANYECYGSGDECRVSDWITIWKGGVTPPSPGITGYYSSTSYPVFPPNYEASTGFYF